MTLPAPAPLTAGGGGGGGITAETDPVLWYDIDNDAYFLRHVAYGDDGAVDSVTITDATGGAFTPSANIEPAGIQPTAEVGAEVVVTYTRVTADTTTNVAAGALAVQIYVVADTVTVEGAAVPSGVAITHDIEGRTTDALAIVTSGGSADVLIIEERP